MANNDSIKFAMHKTAMDYMCGLANYLQNLLNGGEISYEELVYESVMPSNYEFVNFLNILKI